MRALSNRTYENAMREPGKNTTFQQMPDTPFRPLGFFVWGCNQDTIIKRVTIQHMVIPWCSDRPAALFQPSLPPSIVAGLALVDTGFTLRGWQSSAFAPFPIVMPGTYMQIEFIGWAQSVMWWGLEPSGGIEQPERPPRIDTPRELPSISEGPPHLLDPNTEDLDSLGRIDPHDSFTSSEEPDDDGRNV